MSIIYRDLSGRKYHRQYENYRQNFLTNQQIGFLFDRLRVIGIKLQIMINNKKINQLERSIDYIKAETTTILNIRSASNTNFNFSALFEQLTDKQLIKLNHKIEKNFEKLQSHLKIAMQFAKFTMLTLICAGMIKSAKSAAFRLALENRGL